MFTRLSAAVAVLFTSVGPVAWAQQAEKKMTNADVMIMAGAGLRDEIIVAKIHAAPATDFNTDVDGLKALQAAHVSTTVISAMISPHSPASQIASAAVNNSPDDPDAVHSPGIYLYAVSTTGHTLTELERARPKQTKGSGAYLSGITYGITKFKVRAVFDGANAPVKTADPNPAFYLYAPDAAGAFGGSYIKPDDFTLVKLTQKGEKREIVEGSGSIWGTTTGTDDKAKKGFSVEKLKPGVFKFTLNQPLPPGEYAFEQGAGTFYDFRVLPPE